MNKETLIDNSIIVCPKSESKRLIALKTKEAPSLNIKFLDKKEVLEGAYFSFGLEAIDYVAKTYGYSFENAKEIISNAHNVSDVSEKTKIVKNIKEDLLSKGLLTTNERFKYLFANKQTVIIGYSEKDVELRRALELLNVSPSYIKEDNPNVSREVLTYENMEDEVLSLFEGICDLLDDGIDLNDIFVYQPDSDYLPLIKEYSAFYGLPFELKEETKLSDSPLFKRFVSLLDEHEIEEAYCLATDQIGNDPFGASNKLVQAINDCSFAKEDKAHFKALLEYVAKGTNLRQVTYDHSIKFCDASFKAEDTQHIFVLGFSLGSYPKVSLDNDFYSDYEKESLYLNDSKAKSSIEEERLIAFLNGNKNIHISRKAKSGNVEYYDSLLVKKLGYANVSGVLPKTIHSERMAKVLVGKAKDLYRLYNLDTDILNTYSDKEINYKAYSHAFKKIDPSLLPKKINLAYTNINDYNKCPFQYYLKKVLKLNTFESSFASNLGNLFHKVLEDSIIKDIDLIDYQEDIERDFVTEEDKFFVELLLPQVLEVIKKNTGFIKKSKFNRPEVEEKFEIPLSENASLNGRIDKILFDDEGMNLLVVDYKTSNFKYSDPNAAHGLNMQLPLYAYLLKEKYPEYRPVGLYIQNVLFDPLKKDNTDFPYSLVGLTLLDDDVAKRIDPAIGTELNDKGEPISRSSYVNNIVLSNKGVLKKGNSKTLVDEKDLDDKIERTKKLIQLALAKIENGEFDIRPLSGNMELNPCEFCGCQDICFKNASDSLDVKDYEEKVDQELAESTEGGNDDEI